MTRNMDYDYSKTLNHLQHIGLTEREAKVFLTLLTRRMLTALDLQEKVNIPRTKIYEVLQKMVNRGICIEKKVGRNKFFEAVEPKIAFERILETYQNELKRKEEIAHELTDVCTPMFNASKDVMNPLDFIEILRDRNQIHKKYVNVVESTRSELLTFNKGPYACDNPQRLKEQQIVETKLINKGGKCKNIYESFELQDYKWLIEYIEEQRLAGQQAKLIEFLPIKMVISDSEKVMMTLEEPSGQFIMCFIKHGAFGNVCKILFNHFWKQGKDIDDLDKYREK
jgi:sugar-specific transcriptional regulator TrmB